VANKKRQQKEIRLLHCKPMKILAQKTHRSKGLLYIALNETNNFALGNCENRVMQLSWERLTNK